MRQETITLFEYEKVPVADHIVSSVTPEFWDELGITVTRAPGEEGWRAKADSLSGIARTVTTDLDLTVVIKPKLRGADVVFLAERAYTQRVNAFRKPKASKVGVDTTYDDPVVAMLIWYIDSVAEFATRWLRRSYRSERVVLHGQVRGRMLVQTYVAQYRSTARDASVPCVVTVRTIDTPNNRLLKAGLRRVAKLGSKLPVSPARLAVKAAVNTVLPHFAEVSDIEVDARDIRATSSRGPERHYKSILETTVSMLAGHFLSPTLGSSVVESFLWSMPVLFQEALRGVLQSDDFALDESRRPSARIYSADGTRLTSSRIDPDYVVLQDGKPALLDAKYKNALFASESSDDVMIVKAGKRSVKVSRADIYQLAAYRQHEAWAGAPVGLVYPVVLSDGEDVPEPFEVRGLGEPVRLFFIDIGPYARSNLAGFLQLLRRAAMPKPAASASPVLAPREGA